MWMSWKLIHEIKPMRDDMKFIIIIYDQRDQGLIQMTYSLWPMSHGTTVIERD